MNKFTSMNLSIQVIGDRQVSDRNQIVCSINISLIPDFKTYIFSFHEFNLYNLIPNLRFPLKIFD